MKRIPVSVTAIAALLVSGATASVWYLKPDLPAFSLSDVKQSKGRATRPESYANKSSNELALVLGDSARALLLMQDGGLQGNHGNTVAVVPIEESNEMPPVEPTLFNVDDPAVGEHADQIAAVQAMSAEESDDSEYLNQAPGSAIHSVSDNAAHNEQIAHGDTRTAGRSIEPAEVDPDSHPPTN